MAIILSREETDRLNMTRPSAAAEAEAAEKARGEELSAADAKLNDLLGGKK